MWRLTFTVLDTSTLSLRQRRCGRACLLDVAHITPGQWRSEPKSGLFTGSAREEADVAIIQTMFSVDKGQSELRAHKARPSEPIATPAKCVQGRSKGEGRYVCAERNSTSFLERTVAGYSHIMTQSPNVHSLTHLYTHTPHTLLSNTQKRQWQAHA